MWGKGSLWIMGVRIVEDNDNTFQTKDARIIMFNHESVLDILWLCAISPPAFSTVTKNIFRYLPIINLAFWASGQVFINRKNNKQSVQTINALAKHCLKNKRTVVISPEGTRTTTGDLCAFKKGGFYMAIECRFPLYIVLVQGAFESMPPGHFSAHPGTLRLRYLPVIETADWSVDTITEHMDDVREVMQEAILEMRQES